MEAVKPQRLGLLRRLIKYVPLVISGTTPVVTDALGTKFGADRRNLGQTGDGLGFFKKVKKKPIPAKKKLTPVNTHGRVLRSREERRARRGAWKPWSIWSVS